MEFPAEHNALGLHGEQQADGFGGAGIIKAEGELAAAHVAGGGAFGHFLNHFLKIYIGNHLITLTAAHIDLLGCPIRPTAALAQLLQPCMLIHPCHQLGMRSRCQRFTLHNLSISQYPTYS